MFCSVPIKLWVQVQLDGYSIDYHDFCTIPVDCHSSEIFRKSKKIAYGDKDLLHYLFRSTFTEDTKMPEYYSFAENNLIEGGYQNRLLVLKQGTSYAVLVLKLTNAVGLTKDKKFFYILGIYFVGSVFDVSYLSNYKVFHGIRLPEVSTLDGVGNLYMPNNFYNTKESFQSIVDRPRYHRKHGIGVLQKNVIVKKIDYIDSYTAGEMETVHSLWDESRKKDKIIRGGKRILHNLILLVNRDDNSYLYGYYLHDRLYGFLGVTRVHIIDKSYVINWYGKSLNVLHKKDLLRLGYLYDTDSRVITDNFSEYMYYEAFHDSLCIKNDSAFYILGSVRDKSMYQWKSRLCGKILVYPEKSLEDYLRKEMGHEEGLES